MTSCGISSPPPVELFITALWRANKTMIKAGILRLLFLSSWSRGKVGRRGSLDGALRCCVPGLLVQSLAQTRRVHEQTNALAVGSRGQPGKSGQGFQTGCFHCCEEEERRAGWKGPSREVPSDGRCLDMGSRSTSFQSGFLLTDWQGMPGLWGQDGEWELLGECCLSWQLLLGLTEE